MDAAGDDEDVSGDDVRTDRGRDRSHAAGLPTGVAEALLQAGVAVDPVDHLGNTPLMQAAGCGNAGVVRLLLAAGAHAAYRVEAGTALDAARRGKEFEERRKPLSAGVMNPPFVKDFEGVIAA